MNRLQVLGLIGILLLGSCGWPINPEQMPDVMRSLAESKASGCMWTGASGGAGSVAIAPMPIPGGGYGSGAVLFGRVASPNTQLIIKNGECHITSGDALPESMPVTPSPSAPPPAPVLPQRPEPAPSAMPIDYRFLKVETPPANPCDWSWVSCSAPIR
jgi:hypothetical protein